MPTGTRLSLKCKGCGEEFERPAKTNRVNCETCRPPRTRGTAGVKADRPMAPVPDSKPLGPGPMEVAVVTELRQFGREGSVSGTAAILMARQADHGLNTGSQLSGLMDKIQQAVARAIEGVAPVGDRVDELKSARADRLAAVEAS
jgi:hypothetical protein